MCVWGTWLRDDLLTEAMAALTTAAERNGGPVALLSSHRLDARFPLDVNFRGNLPGVKATLAELKPRLAGCAVVLEFGGFLAATMKATVGVINTVVAPSLPMKVLSSRVEAIQWLLPTVREDIRLSAREYLEAAARVDKAYARRRDAAVRVERS